MQLLPLRRLLRCVPKKYIDDKLKKNCPFTKIIGTLITKTLSHRQVFLVSHLTYFVQLFYLARETVEIHHEFSLKLLIFSILQY